MGVVFKKSVVAVVVGVRVVDVAVFIGEVGISETIDVVELVMFNLKVVVVSVNGVEDIDGFIDELTDVVGIVEMVVVECIWKVVIDVFIGKVVDVVGILAVGVDVLIGDGSDVVKVNVVVVDILIGVVAEFTAVVVDSDVLFVTLVTVVDSNG